MIAAGYKGNLMMREKTIQIDLIEAIPPKNEQILRANDLKDMLAARS